MSEETIAGWLPSNREEPGTPAYTAREWDLRMCRDLGIDWLEYSMRIETAHRQEPWSVLRLMPWREVSRHMIVERANV